MQCSVCQMPATLLCGRCFQRYCSPGCQIQDWPEHKYECKELPPLLDADSVFKDNSKLENTATELSKKCNSEDVEFEKQAEIQPKKYAANNRQVEANETISSSSGNSGFKLAVASTPQVLQKAGAAGRRFESPDNTNNFVKNKAANAANSPDVEVKREETIKASTEKPRRESVANDTSDYNKTGFKKEASNSIADNVESNFGKLSTGLTRAMINESSSASNRPSPKKKYLLEELPISDLREGDNIPVVVTDTSFLDKFIIALMIANPEEHSALKENLDKLAEYCEKAAKEMKGYKPEKNEVCLAIFDEDGQWYRAYCQKKKDDGDFIVQFVDYGNIAIVSPKNIMPMADEMMFATCTHMCHIVNIKKDQVKSVKKYIDENSVIKVDIRYNEINDLNEVAIKNLQKMLN